MSQTQFSHNLENNSITIRHSFKSELSKVWAAWTTAEILQQWFAPKPYKLVTKTLEFKPGGKWHFCMVGENGEKGYGLHTYLEIEPEKYYVVRDSFSDEAGNVDASLPSGIWHNEFSQEGQNTTLNTIVTYETAEDMAQIMATPFEESYANALNNLDQYLAGH